MTRTFTPKGGEIQRNWIIIDAENMVLGRVASHAAAILRGKNKPTFAPFIDTGDFVIVVNAAKMVLSGKKGLNKRVYRHSGYPGGITSIGYGDLLATDPVRALERAVRGMLPKNSVGREQFRKLKVYAGPEHPHAAQQPIPYTFPQVAQ